MDELLFVDSTFEKDNTSRYKLSIQLCLDGFSFSILNSNNKCLVLYQSKSLNSDTDNTSIDLLKDSIRNCDYLNLSYKQVAVIWLTQKTCLIPSDLFSEELATDCLQLCHPVSKDEVVLWHEISEMNAHLAYALPSALPVFIKTHFADAEISNQSYRFYKKIFKQAIDIKHPKIFVQVYDHFFDAFIPDIEQKHFANSFSFKNETDMVYFILNIYKQQKLNTEYSHLHLSGKIDESGQAFQTLKRYIKDIHIENVPHEIPQKKHISNSEYNQFTKLLNTSQCE
ncbi:DUF3822 family protein [Ancylomarina salipaludis]|uniref:DUF3822 family protein n=1 Tax=Ancylomarina salipaludis TaxID=2501299 RepID=A0A4V1MZW4_9BACT|nr:DUF3822 family protein [Ancylomarina salipaludis]RXQ90420.1 DUF3822 family protein [Ancylomarina salipaludis]